MSKFGKCFVSTVLGALFLCLSCINAYAVPSDIEKGDASAVSIYYNEPDFFNEDEWRYDDTMKAAAIPNVCEIDANFTPDDVLNSSARSTSKPTSFWDLTKKKYNASLLQVSCVNVLYTNYYFNCNSNRELYVDYSLYSDTGREVALTIRLYDLDKKTYLDWKTDYFNNVDHPSSTKGPFTGAMYFYNIDIGTRYAIAFLSNKHPDSWTADMLHGSAVIHH